MCSQESTDLTVLQVCSDMTKCRQL